MTEQEAANDWVLRRLFIDWPLPNEPVVTPEVPDGFFDEMMTFWTSEGYIEHIRAKASRLEPSGPTLQDEEILRQNNSVLYVLVRRTLSDNLADEDILAYAQRWQERRRTDNWQRLRRADWAVHTRPWDADIGIILQDFRVLVPCLCCGYLSVEGSCDICHICFWGNDFEPHPDDVLGLNRITLIKGQANFLRMGACDEPVLQFVRSPDDCDVRDPGWRPVDLSRDVDESGRIKPAADDRDYPYYWRYIR